MIKIITSTRVLMQLAREVGKARKEGDVEKLREAEERLEEYRALCLESDEMRLDC